MSAISAIIKARIKEAKASFYSTNNISEFIKEGELEKLQDEVEEKFKGVLDSLIIDTDNDHNTKETAHRVAKMYLHEVFRGRYYAEPKNTEFPNYRKYDDMYIVGPIHINSFCAHHFLPIIGEVWVGILEPKTLIGLSKFHRLTRWITERPSIQEESIVMLADILEEKIKPSGLGVYMTANHTCVSVRGVKDKDSTMGSSVMRGTFRSEPSVKQEFLNLINMSKKQ